MELKDIQKYLSLSKCGKAEKFGLLSTFFIGGFIMTDELQRLCHELGVHDLSHEEATQFMAYDNEVNEPLRISEDLGFTGILGQHRKRFIQNIDVVKELSIRKTYKEVWRVKHKVDNSNILQVTSNTDHYITFLEEYGFVALPDTDMMVSRTVQPVYFSEGKSVTDNVVFIMPAQSEIQFQNNVPTIRAFGGGVGLYAVFKQVVLSRKFMRKYSIPTNMAFACVGYCESFEKLDSPVHRVDGYIEEWIIG